MLKITKGLKPASCITTYTDDKGNQYVRMTTGEEDFCICLHDFVKGGGEWFTWNEATKMLKDEGLTLPTLEQVETYNQYIPKINSKLEEMDGEPLKNTWYDCYWTSNIYSEGKGIVWIYWGRDGVTKLGTRSNSFRVCPILNLK